MVRPKLPRKICGKPACSYFKPNGKPLRELEVISLEHDEFEALRLVDNVGLQQIEAAKKLGVSRQTLANIVKSARFKVSTCLIEGKALFMNNSQRGEKNDHSNDDD